MTDARTDLPVSGDETLAAQVRPMLTARHDVWAAATVVDGRVRVATVGAPLDGHWEIGSVSKGVTGLLYADAVERGEVTGATAVGELLDLDGSPVAGVTLAALATHRAGLRRMPRAGQPWRRSVALLRHGTNPYGESLAGLLDQARPERVGRARARYSNLGFQLLGHAVAAAAGTTYAELVRTRVAEPLGLTSVHVPATTAQLRPGAVPGRGRSGRPREPWVGEGIGPAGGIRASVADLAALTRAMLDGSAPGGAALDPRASMGPGARIGYAWVVVDARGRTVTWHNGGTGGFRAWLGMDRAAGVGAVVLTARSVSVDRAGMALLLATP